MQFSVRERGDRVPTFSSLIFRCLSSYFCIVTIPKDATIAIEKIRDYLLKPLDVDDKSGYLALAGYSRKEYWELLRDIREQLLPAEAEYQERNSYGDFYELIGFLTGPNGRRLGVRTIWVNDEGTWRFVTLFPD
jgi:hypothetical protein